MNAAEDWDEDDVLPCPEQVVANDADDDPYNGQSRGEHLPLPVLNFGDDDDSADFRADVLPLPVMQFGDDEF